MSEPQTIVIRPTLDDLKANKSVLYVKEFAFFIQAWRIDAVHPLQCVVRGALFTFPLTADDRPRLDKPQCILGTRADRPAEAQIMLATAPGGQIENWTARDLQHQEMYITLPTVIPWLKQPTTYHLAGAMAARVDRAVVGPGAPDANPSSTS